MNTPAFAKGRSVLQRPNWVRRYRHPTTQRYVWRAIGCALNAFVKTVVEARRAARAYNELAAMTDPELHDIGINRSDIAAAAFGAHAPTSRG
jgi:uncharacterized protein YjiS (DUF1127 family)